MTDLTLYAVMLVASFVRVFARSFQQLNVTHHQRRWVVPTSYVMAFAEIFTQAPVAVVAVGGVLDPQRPTLQVVVELLVAGIVIGTGGWSGAMAGMGLHKRLKLS